MNDFRDLLAKADMLFERVDAAGGLGMSKSQIFAEIERAEKQHEAASSSSEKNALKSYISKLYAEYTELSKNAR